MTDRFLHGVHVRDGRWAGRAARLGRRVVGMAVHGIGRWVGIAPRPHGRVRTGGTRLRHAVEALRIMPMALHRQALSVGGAHSARVVHHADLRAGQMMRAATHVAVHGEGQVRASRGFATHGHRQALRHAARGYRAPRVARLELSRGVGDHSVRRPRPDGSGIAGRALAPRSRGGRLAGSTETMGRELARSAAETLRREDRSLDSVTPAPGRGGHVPHGSEFGHALPDRLHDAKGPLPTHLRDEVQHALHEVKLDPRAEMRRLFAEESRRPPSGVTGFDHRLAPIWPGRKPGY